MTRYFNEADKLTVFGMMIIDDIFLLLSYYLIL